jgi:hypothetical protein
MFSELFSKENNNQRRPADSMFYKDGWTRFSIHPSKNISYQPFVWVSVITFFLVLNDLRSDQLALNIPLSVNAFLFDNVFNHPKTDHSCGIGSVICYNRTVRLVFTLTFPTLAAVR